MSADATQNNYFFASQMALASLYSARYTIKAAKYIHRLAPHTPIIKNYLNALAPLGTISRYGTPFKIGIAATYLGIGVMRRDSGMLAGSVGMISGNILGGMAAGAATGFVVGAVGGSPTGPFAIVTALALGVAGGAVGGIVGEKVARHYLTKSINDLTGWNKKSQRIVPNPISMAHTHKSQPKTLAPSSPKKPPLGYGGLKSLSAGSTDHMTKAASHIIPHDRLIAVGCHKASDHRVHCRMAVPQNP